MGEELALAHATDLPLVILRPPVVYGPRETDLYTYVRLLSKGIHPCLMGQDQHFNLCYVQDVVEAIPCGFRDDGVPRDLLRLGWHRLHDVEEIGDAFVRAMGSLHTASLSGGSFTAWPPVSEIFSKFSGKPLWINRERWKRWFNGIGSAISQSPNHALL
jgi:nucleoside-diphosphate-sugar epimerase